MGQDVRIEESQQLILVEEEVISSPEKVTRVPSNSKVLIEDLDGQDLLEVEIGEEPLILGSSQKTEVVTVIEEVVTVVALGEQGPPGVSGLHAQFADLPNFVKFTYVGGTLTKKEIFRDDTESLKLYNIDYSYTLGNLTSIQVTRMSDMSTYTKTFTYLNEDLIEINIT